MDKSKVIQTFQNAAALLEGHFLLSSGLHSNQYLQCARVLEDPQLAQKLAQSLAQKFKGQTITAVVGPALGGIILAYELARALNARALFTEREDGTMRLRRGFCLSKKDKVLIAEDVITTGGSVKEVIAAVGPSGAEIVGVAALIDRSGEESAFGKISLHSLAKIEIAAYPAQDCPMCQKNLPLIKPGSRK